MKAMDRIGFLVGVFAFAMAGIYAWWTNSAGYGTEWVGVVGLILGGLLGFMNFFVLMVFRRQLDTDPSDDPLGEIDDIAGEYGQFSPHSWQPLFLAAAAAVCFLGLAVGWWLFIIGAFFAIPALIGWTFEYWKGEHAL